MRIARAFALVVIVGLSAAGCTELSSAGAEFGTSTVTLAANDSGRTIPLRVGDRLVVNLGTSFAAPADGLIRASVQYPRSLMTLWPDKGKLGRWEFTATTGGTGKVTVISAPCGRLLGPVPNGAIPCAEVGGANGSVTRRPATEPDLPARLFFVTVNIT
jgi:hypothetical protein